MSKIIPLIQPQGFSTHIIAKKVAEKLGEKTSHTGTLDPMAQGIIVVLVGEERLKKEKYADSVKGYEFDLVLGLSSDTHDAMGLIDFDSKLAELKRSLVEKKIEDFKGTYEQKYPAFSAKKVKGKPLHFLKKTEGIGERPTKKGEIFEIKVVEEQKTSIFKTGNNAIEQIKNVSGDFRQEEIILLWQKLIKDFGEEVLSVYRIYVETSKGIYVRQLAADVASSLGCRGIANNIRRVRNGEFSYENSLTLENFFGTDFLQTHDFDSNFIYKY